MPNSSRLDGTQWRPARLFRRDEIVRVSSNDGTKP